MQDGDIWPQRTSHSGKTTHYDIRHGVLNGFINLLETGKSRHGVQSARALRCDRFLRDQDVKPYTHKIYARDSKKVVGRFDFVFGYFETSAVTKIHCWTHSDCLESDQGAKTESKN